VPMTYVYHCVLDRVVDGDTIDVSIDLGFKVWLHKERVRLYGINCPECRTKDLVEKAKGLASKDRLIELLPEKFIIQTTKDGKGKYGRILGIPFVDKVDICQQMVKEGHATAYYGGKKTS